MSTKEVYRYSLYDETGEFSIFSGPQTGTSVYYNFPENKALYHQLQFIPLQLSEDGTIVPNLLLERIKKLKAFW